jgi:hypothetical protein
MQEVLLDIPCAYHKYKLPTWGSLYILHQAIYFEQKPFNEKAPEHVLIWSDDIISITRTTTFATLTKAICIQTKNDEQVCLV